MILFLHEKGYTFFTIPNLTYFEIDKLVDACNRRVKNQEKEAKKAKQKASRNKGRYKR